MQAWELQRRIAAQRADGLVPDTLLLLEHSHVFTAGRRSESSHLLADPATLSRIGAQFIESDRGGQTTYHGPGQLVGYPILSLQERGMGPKQYIRTLERALVGTLAGFGIIAHTEDGFTGVWVGDAKIAAIGVRISRGVTTHGFALNIDPDLSYFHHIIPCGITDRGVTSIAQLSRTPFDAEAVRQSIIAHFASNFALAMHSVPGRSL